MDVILRAKSYAGPGTVSSSVAGIGTLAAIGPTYVLCAAGFCAAGIKSGSIAAGVQSAVYGGSVRAGGIFATLQSWGRREPRLERLELWLYG